VLAQLCRQLGDLSGGSVEPHQDCDELELPVLGRLHRRRKFVRNHLWIADDLIKGLNRRPDAPSLVQRRHPLVLRPLHKPVGD